MFVLHQATTLSKAGRFVGRKTNVGQTLDQLLCQTGRGLSAVFSLSSQVLEYGTEYRRVRLWEQDSQK